jgi:hypothetical protein
MWERHGLAARLPFKIGHHSNADTAEAMRDHRVERQMLTGFHTSNL